MKKIPTIQIRGYHLDIYGHVNNARYLEFLEEGRWSVFDGSDAVATWQKEGMGFYVVNINVNYRDSARVGDTVRVHTKLSRIGNTSAAFHQEIVIQETGKVCVDADVTFVIADKTGRPIPMAGRMEELLRKMCG